MDGPDALLDRGADRLHVGGGERVHEVDADRRDDLLRARCTVNKPFDRSTPGWPRAIAQIDETTSNAAGSPMRSPLASRARNMATTPSRTPMPMDAAPSSTGRCNVSLIAIPARAITTPISAAVSSKSTMNIVGSLLSRTASKYPRSPFAERNSLIATPQETPSNTKARLRTA